MAAVAVTRLIKTVKVEEGLKVEFFRTGNDPRTIKAKRIYYNENGTTKGSLDFSGDSIYAQTVIPALYNIREMIGAEKKQDSAAVCLLNLSYQQQDQLLNLVKPDYSKPVGSKYIEIETKFRKVTVIDQGRPKEITRQVQQIFIR